MAEKFLYRYLKEDESKKDYGYKNASLAEDKIAMWRGFWAEENLCKRIDNKRKEKLNGRRKSSARQCRR